MAIEREKLEADVLIIGAGPAGLSCGYRLSKAGRDVLILEADSTYVGGISRTASYKEFLFDIGGHRFFSKAKEVVDILARVVSANVRPISSKNEKRAASS